MPLTGYKVVMFVREDRFGAAETHYTLLTTQSLAGAAALTLAKKRIALMPADVSMFAVRVSNTGPPHDSVLLDPAGWANTPKWKPVGNEDPMADQGKATALVQIPMTTRFPARVYLFGVPDQLLGDDEVPMAVRAPPSWNVNWQTYAAELQANWGTRTLTPAAGNLGPFPVTGYQNRALDSKLQVSLAGAPAGLVVGAKVHLRGFKMSNPAYQPVNGKYAIVLVEPGVPASGQTQYTLSANRIVDSAQIVTPGTVELIDYTTTPYGGVPILLRATTRKRGNRFLTGPGARRVRAKI